MREVVEALRSQPHVEKFESEHPEYSFANVFYPDYAEGKAELGYYHEEDDVMINVLPNGSTTEPQEVAHTGREIKQLRVTEEVADAEDAVKKAKNTSDVTTTKRVIATLQQPGEPHWSVSLITPDFSVYTVRMHAETLDVLDTTESNMMSWIKGT